MEFVIGIAAVFFVLGMLIGSVLGMEAAEEADTTENQVGNVR